MLVCLLLCPQLLTWGPTQSKASMNICQKEYQCLLVILQDIETKLWTLSKAFTPIFSYGSLLCTKPPEYSGTSRFAGKPHQHHFFYHLTIILMLIKLR